MVVAAATVSLLLCQLAVQPVHGSSGPSVLPPPYQGPVEIHLLPHSHQDAGFIVTYSHVRDQLCDRTYETIFECLRDDSTRTFNVMRSAAPN